MSLQWSGGKRVTGPAFRRTARPQRRAGEGAWVMRLTTHKASLLGAAYARQQGGLVVGREAVDGGRLMVDSGDQDGNGDGGGEANGGGAGLARAAVIGGDLSGGRRQTAMGF